jgi:hypothetical protein
MEQRKCINGCVDGVSISNAFEYAGKFYPETRRPCSTCLGAGVMAQPDWQAIADAVTTTRGAAKGKRVFRKSAPEGWKKSNQGIQNRREYYVWRIARFHGGADVTLPMTAELFCGKDAWKPELEAYASALAKAVFGTDLAAAHRWTNALGGNVNIKGLPPSAYSGGPVQDGNKPSFEREELK